jgi:hypothetical protein
VPDDEPTGVVLLPDAIRERFRQMERPPVPLLRGTVTEVGEQRGRVPLPNVGDRVWVLPKPGLIVEPGDIDLPDLGAEVPSGHTLRLYGVGDAWHDQIVAIELGAVVLGAIEDAQTKA